MHETPRGDFYELNYSFVDDSPIVKEPYTINNNLGYYLAQRFLNNQRKLKLLGLDNKVKQQFLREDLIESIRVSFEELMKIMSEDQIYRSSIFRPEKYQLKSYKSQIGNIYSKYMNSAA